MRKRTEMIYKSIRIKETTNGGAAIYDNYTHGVRKPLYFKSFGLAMNFIDKIGI